MRAGRNILPMLAVLIVAMLAACGWTTGVQPVPTPTPEAAEASPAATATPTEAPQTGEAPVETPAQTGGWMEPYPETVTVTIVNDEMVSAVFPEGEDICNNIWTKAWKKDFNIDVKTLWVSSDYEAKLNLAIAAKDLPDMFCCNTVQFGQLVAADLLQPLDDVYARYASPKVHRMMEQEDPDIFNTAKRNGKLMGLPRLHYGYECYTYYMWVKKNWYEEAGSPQIKTLNQFEALMKSFMKKYGSAYAMPLSKNLEQFYFMAPTWHAYPKIWVEDATGRIAFGSTMPEMKTMLAKWAQWYKDGILRPDFATLDFNTMEADVLNGLVGVQPGENWYSWVISDTYKNTGDGTWLEPYDLPSADGKQIKYPIPFPNNIYNVVSKSAKNPEVLVKLVNYYSYILNEAVATGEKTVEEVLPFSENNLHHTTGPFKVEFRSYHDIKEVVAAVKAGEKNPKFSSGYAYNYFNEIMKWYNSKDPTALGRTLQMGQERSSLNLGCGYVDRDLLVKSKLWGATPQALLDYGTNLDELLKEGFTKIIMGEEPVDYFDTLITEWKAAGGDEATAAINEMYGKK